MLKLDTCWENEISEDDCITSFVALGPKTYSYTTLKGKENTKCKGFTLNSENSETMNHQKMIDLLLQSKSSRNASVTLSNRKFKWDRRNGEYWLSIQSKTLRVTADKNEMTGKLSPPNHLDTNGLNKFLFQKVKRQMNITDIQSIIGINHSFNTIEESFLIWTSS